MNNDKNKKTSKTGSSWIALVILFFVTLFSGAEKKDGIFFYIVYVFIFVCSAMIILALIKTKLAKRADRAGTKSAAAEEKYAARDEKAVHFDAERQSGDSKYSGYDHDTAHRLEQLDSFYKNGIVDKKEYKQLRERYLNDRPDY